MKIFVAGHRGMVGSEILRQLQARNCGATLITRTSSELDLTDQRAVRDFMQSEKPDEVIIAAAKVGGIHANNSYPADFIYQNLMIECNVIHEAFRVGVSRLLQMGSSCIYPRAAPQPIPEDALMQGPLEPTNELYAFAKIAGIKLCESYNRQYGTDYRSVMPTNLYGPGDNFHPENAHVLPALLRRFHEAVEQGQDDVAIWGSGRARREFLYVEDMAAACLFVHDLPLEAYQRETTPTRSFLNAGCGRDIAVLELAQLIAEVTGFSGRITPDTTRPEGMPVKCLDVSRMARLGWQPHVELREGIARTYDWFLHNINELRSV